jgi:hypothetical protein
MREIIVVLSAFIFLCGFIIYFTELSRAEEKYKINCNMLLGGWHPDVPQKYREMCLAAKQERNDR